MNFGVKLKDLRENLNVKQRDLADIIGIKENLYCMYENEYQSIPLKYLIIVADYFNVSIDFLFALNSLQCYKEYKKSFNLIVFSERFKIFRKNLKITQQHLALKLNIARSVISDYEKGKKLINTAYLYDLCKKYQVSADYLLGKIDYIPEWCIKKNE